MLNSCRNLIDIIAVFHFDHIPSESRPLFGQRSNVIHLSHRIVDL